MKKKNQSVILMVGDKSANFLSLENLLAADNRLLLHAATGKDALHISLTNKIDLIILDAQMPDMDGFEVAQILKSNNQTKNIPLIFATAGSKERKFAMNSYDEGIIDYLIKPFDPEIAKAKITLLLKIQLQQQELIEKNFLLEKSELLINNSVDIIGIVDAGTLEIDEMNNAFPEILGYTLEEIKGKLLAFFIGEEDKYLLQKLTSQTTDKLIFETRVVRKDNSLRWLQWKMILKNSKWFVNARDVTEQKMVSKHIDQLNNDLHNKIIQLEASNKEMESFSYSVSHDLRAPLRAINGYSDILEEDYAEQLGEGGKNLLAKIKNSARRMGILIDDLLEFSKLGRKEVHKMKIDMEDMVRTVIAEMNISKNEQTVIKINSLPPAYADYNLVHQVWINIISNAIKYSSKKEKPEIEIGSTTSNQQTAYFVKDNGAGFDMKYAGKLFGVFQRLHGVSEFPGTGVGLAIVFRIITKHGGKIWAEAKLNEGAVFYFTLPKEKLPQIQDV